MKIFNKNQNFIETIVGAFVLLLAISFFIFAYRATKSSSNDQVYSVYAKFQNVDGIFAGSSVIVSGIKIGTVKNLVLDRDDFFVMVELEIDSNIKLPLDSQASILSAGFFGSKFVAISPGVDQEDIKHGDRIKFTQSAINMEELIGKFMYQSAGK